MEKFKGEDAKRLLLRVDADVAGVFETLVVGDEFSSV